MTPPATQTLAGPALLAPEAGPGDPLWYKDAIIYELHVRAFADSNDDGNGDFRGLVTKLDYLQDLGATAIWLLPFYPSPLRDDGYDTADYRQVHPAYGNLRDFRVFLREAHARGLRVITELVLNHTSDQHPWFQRARRARPGSSHRNFYVWSDTPDRYTDARIIFKDFESSNWTWDPVAKAYYWHRFYSHQPDLNWENPEVRKALFRTVDYWFDMGVDGLRLDAVPYLFEREGTNCENLPETHQALKDLRRHIDATHHDKMLLAEANQWPEEAVSYFGDGDECHMAFHFPLMPRMFMAIRMEDRFPVIDILHETPGIPESSQWAIFLRNHDELTLEMVTDEERDYMYRVYAEDPQARINLGIRHRLAPLLGNNRRLIEMMNGLLFSLPGTPVIYYGDEIGMGDNIYLGDRNGVRTPMQWSSDRNAGFSTANPQRLYLPIVIDPEYSAASLNVEAQQRNPHSLLWFMKRLIALRKRHQAFSRGSLEFLYPENRKVLTFLRTCGDENILVVANLSRYAQYVELDLSRFEGTTPVNLLGGVEFPRIGELPYLLTLGPHDFYWFVLEPPLKETPAEAYDRQAPTIDVAGPWQTLLGGGRATAPLERALPAYLRSRRWFGGKASRIKSASVDAALPVPGETASSEPLGYLAFVHVEYQEGDGETYVLPLVGMRLDENTDGDGLPTVAHLRTADGDVELVDGLLDADFNRGLLDLVSRRRKAGVGQGQLVTSSTGTLRAARAGRPDLTPALLRAEQSNSSIVYGDRLILKFFRRLEEGLNPDLEIGRFLSDRLEAMPKLAGALEYQPRRGEPMTLAIVQAFVPNEGDAWAYTLDAVGRFFEDVLARRVDPDEPPVPEVKLLALSLEDVPDLAHETIGTYLESARVLGLRTAEMHLALCDEDPGSPFAPEPFSALYQRARYQGMRTLARQTLSLLRRLGDTLPEAAPILDREADIVEALRSILEPDPANVRIRGHGDFHLGQVLFTGKDFVIIDFEGEPARSIGERRIKHSPLRDVAGLIRSFHYAVYTELFRQTGGAASQEERSAAERWARFWYQWVSATYLRAYLDRAGAAAFIPREPADIQDLLDAMLLEKALYELRYEANNRPDWLSVPVQGLLDLLDHGQET